MKKITIFVIVLFFIFSCASGKGSQKGTSSGEIVSQTATNAAIDIVKNVKPDPFTIVWGGLGLIATLCGIAGGKSSSNQWKRYMVNYGGYEDIEDATLNTWLFDYYVDYDYIIKIDDDSLTW